MSNHPPHPVPGANDTDTGTGPTGTGPGSTGPSGTAPSVPWWAATSRHPYLSPAQVRTRTLRGTLSTLAFTLALLTGIGWVLLATDVKDVTTTDFGALAHKQTTEALIGGCGPVYTFPDITGQYGTVPATTPDGVPLRQQYHTAVPMFGPFWADPVPTDRVFWSRTGSRGFPVAENLLHNMWQGDMVIYYTSTLPEDEVRALRRFAVLNRDLDALVVPWEEDVRLPMPQYRKIALVTWNASQTCHSVAVPALFDFRDMNPAHHAPGHDGTPPPRLLASDIPAAVAWEREGPHLAPGSTPVQ